MVDLLISGPEGKIEAKYTHNNNDKSPIVHILHPDPSRGGTMNTKIIFKLYKLFVNNVSGGVTTVKSLIFISYSSPVSIFSLFFVLYISRINSCLI